MAQQSREYQVSFVTPAFLGDAEQKGRWRTPPFKALLRQWWRVVKARDCGYRHEQLREAEGRLFGHAWLKRNGTDKTWAMRSQVRLALSGANAWQPGAMTTLPGHPQVRHPEVNRPTIAAHVYLGYGPVGNETRLAIGPGESATLTFGSPGRHAEELCETMQLIDWFGTVGSRSRNGWGSVALSGPGLSTIKELRAGNLALPDKLARPWADCLGLEWPHAFGRDDKGLLLWETAPSRRWEGVMQALAEAKIAFRTQFPFAERDAGLHARHLLAYPVTHHNINEWGDRIRLANQIRFKVGKLGSECVGLVAHLPCGLPEPLKGRLSREDREKVVALERDAWSRVHQSLDRALTRIGGRAS